MTEQSKVYEKLNSLIGEKLQFPQSEDINRFHSDVLYVIENELERIEYELYRQGEITELYTHKIAANYYHNFAFCLRTNVGLEIVNKDGKFIKRLAKWLKDSVNWKLSSDELGKIGSVLKHYMPLGYIPFDITDKFNWESGDFGDSGSCFWGCRSNAKIMLADIGTLAIRFYKDEYQNGIGRAWLYPLPEHNGIGIFNAYGKYEIDTIARMLKEWFKVNFEMDIFTKHIDFRINNSDTGTIWINGGCCVLISDIEYPKLKLINITGINEIESQCVNCGRAIDEDSVIYVDDEMYCENCATMCEHCDEYFTNDNIYEVNCGNYVCYDCRNRYYSCCQHCDNWVHNNDLNETQDGYLLCENCMYDDTYRCENCGDVYYRMHYMTKINNDLYCDNCANDIEENIEENEGINDNGN